MKRSLLMMTTIIIILALLLSFGITGCTTEETSTTAATPPPTSTTPPPTSTTPPPTSTTPAVLSSIAVTPASPADLTAGSTQRFEATGTYSDGSSSKLYGVTWNSDNPSVATINIDGIATGVAAGQTNITASQAGITSSPVSLTVLAPPPPPETTTPPEETTTPPEETTTPAVTIISWEDAANHIGELITVEGPIIDKWDIGTSMLLGMGKSAVQTGTVGIEISYALAAELPADLYVGKTIRVTGTPYLNPLGGASIIVEDASKIVVPGEEAPPETTTPAVTIISWEDAANHIGELITVEGPIIDKWDIGTSMLLGMGKSAVQTGTVGIEISYALAAELPADLYVGKTIRVTGTPYLNPLGGASIIVEDASKIEVVE